MPKRPKLTIQDKKAKCGRQGFVIVITKDGYDVEIDFHPSFNPDSVMTEEVKMIVNNLQKLHVDFVKPTKKPRGSS